MATKPYLQGGRPPRGTITHKPGQIRYRVCLTLPSGVKKRLDSTMAVPKNIGPRALKEAMSECQNRIDQWVVRHGAEFKSAAGRREDERTKRFTVREWVDYADAYLMRQSQATKAIRKLRIEKHWFPVIGDMMIDEVSPMHLQPVITSMEQAGMSYATVVGVKGAIGVYFKKATEFLPYMGKNPITPIVVDHRRVAKSKARWLRPDEISRFIEANRGTKALDFAMLGLFLGLRRGEILGLRWSRVDLDRGWLKIDHTVINEGGASVAKDAGKTDAAVRLLPIPPALLSWLREKRQAEPDTVYVVWPKGRALDRHNSVNTFDRAMRLGVERAGLDKPSVHEDQRDANPVTAHTFRHTFSVFLGQSGLDDYHQNYLFGHSQKSLRAKVYQKPILELLPAAMARVESMMLGQTDLSKPDALAETLDQLFA